jgi:hypothetical protein
VKNTTCVATALSVEEIKFCSYSSIRTSGIELGIHALKKVYFLTFSLLLRKNTNYLFHDVVHTLSNTFLTLKCNANLRPSPKPPDRPKFPSSLIFSGCSGFFLQGRSERSVKVTTHLHLVLRLTRRVFTLPVYLHSKDRDNFTFTTSVTLDNKAFLASVLQNPRTTSKVMYTYVTLDFTQIKQHLFIYV